MMPTIMHLQMMVIALAIAIIIRIISVPTLGLFFRSQTLQHRYSWQHRWTKALSAFLVPPLFLLMTALAIIIMGPSSCHAWEGLLSYQISIIFLFVAGLLWLHLGWLGLVSQQNVQKSPAQVIQTSFGDISSHVLDLPIVFSAQVGCWKPKLALSHRLIETLNGEQLSAVIAHENGHAYYQDTFWFLWLGGLRRLTCWLPGTASLWQELLLLREMRADRWATQYVDKLVLAESLLQVVSLQADSKSAANASGLSIAITADFSCPTSADRLSQRIDAILTEADISVETNTSDSQWIASWIAMSWSLAPLLTIPLHQ